MNVQEYWNELQEQYQVKQSITDWLLGYPTVVEQLGDLSEKTIVDLGCGSGQFALHLARTHPLATVVGVDTSEQAITQAREYTEESLGVRFEQISSESDIATYAPDAICMNFLLCTIPSVSGLHRIVTAAYNALSPGGVLVMLNPHPDSHGRTFTSFRSEQPRTKESGAVVHVYLKTNGAEMEFDDYYWTKEDYTGTLRDSGFSTVETQEPLAEGDSSDRLLDEVEVPPYIIHTATK